MESNNSQLLLDAHTEGVQQSTQHRIARRQFIKTSAGVAAAGALLGRRAFAAPRSLKIGYVSPETGVLAPFGDADSFVIETIRKKFQDGIMSGGATRPVEILVRDSQSSPNRCAEVTAGLIKSDRVDLVVVAGTPDTVNPVADQCEINQTPCVSTDAPWQPYFFSRGGNPAKGFDWTYHFFWGVDTMAEATCDEFDLLPNNKVAGMLMGNDVDGLAQADPVRGMPPVVKARGYTVVDPGRFDLNSADFSAQIAAFKKAQAEIVFGVIPLPTFSNFWAQAAQLGYYPKQVNFGQALLFPRALESLGPRGKYLTSIAWWTPAYPFKSSLTDQSAAQLCDQYEEVTKKEWTEALGFRHALYEVAVDVFKRVQNPESAASVIDAVRTTKLNTIVGPVQWQGPPPNQWTIMPVKNVCTTPLAPAQWVPGKKWMYDFVIVDNKRYPLIPVQAKMMPVEA